MVMVMVMVMLWLYYEPAVVRLKEVTVGRGVKGKMGEVQGPIATSGPPSGRTPAAAKHGALASARRHARPATSAPCDHPTNTYLSK